MSRRAAIVIMLTLLAATYAKPPDIHVILVPVMEEESGEEIDFWYEPYAPVTA